LLHEALLVLFRPWLPLLAVVELRNVLEIGAQALLELIVGDVVVVPIFDQRASKLLSEPACVTLYQRRAFRRRSACFKLAKLMCL
jgi:hypothetical protein